MKKTVLIIAAIILSLTSWGQVRYFKPDSTVTLTYKSVAYYESADADDDLLYREFYGDYCSWYCGFGPFSEKASSHLAPIGNMTYEANNAHDFNHESVWAEGVDGPGIGEYLEYEFHGDCGRVTTVKILNGYVKNKTVWKNNARVKKLKMYYSGEPYAILELEDSRNLQYFNVGVLGYHDVNAPNWTLRFEILEVYEGEKYEDTVIAELYFDGIDDH